MNTEHLDSQENKPLPGTLLNSEEITQPQDSHHHILHERRHSLSYIPPSLVEV
jgi:hypothetical protein